MIHLDTSFLIRALAAGSPEDRRLRGWLQQGEELRVSVIAWSEFLCGPVGEREIGLAERVLGDPEPFVAADAGETARLFNRSGRRRGSLLDCMIAAIALRAGAALATANAMDFRRLAAAGGPRLA
ncbi:MAG: PIN domain-containing protein [Candidatus Binatia bacterium]